MVSLKTLAVLLACGASTTYAAPGGGAYGEEAPASGPLASRGGRTVRVQNAKVVNVQLQRAGNEADILKGSLVKNNGKVQPRPVILKQCNAGAMRACENEAGVLRDLLAQPTLSDMIPPVHADGPGRSWWKPWDSQIYKTWIIMDVADGGSMQQAVTGTPKLGSSLTPEQRQGVPVRLLKAVAAVHAAGYAHVEVIPSNVLFSFSRKGDDGKEVPDVDRALWLTNFQLSRKGDYSKGSKLNQPPQEMASPEFLSASNSLWSTQIDLKPTDVWMAGETIAMWLFGWVPQINTNSDYQGQSGDDLTEYWSRYYNAWTGQDPADSALPQLLGKMMHPDPSQRPTANGDDIASAFEKIDVSNFDYTLVTAKSDIDNIRSQFGTLINNPVRRACC